MTGWKTPTSATLSTDVGERLFAAHVIHDMWQATSGDSVVVTDVGQHQMWEAQYYPHQRPHTLITSGGLGTMGFGCQRPSARRWGWGSPTCGPSSATAASDDAAGARHGHAERVPVNIAIMNNGFLGMVRQWQEFFYEERHNATPMHNGLRQAG